MKRAAILFAVILSLLLVGAPSAPSLAGSAPSTRSADGGAPGDEVRDDNGAGGGNADGDNEGDADGLGGIRRKTPGLYGGDGDVTIVLRTWWKFIVWLR